MISNSWLCKYMNKSVTYNKPSRPVLSLCRIAGFHHTGRIEVGRRADLLLFEKDLRLKRTVIAGRTAYHDWQIFSSLLLSIYCSGKNTRQYNFLWWYCISFPCAICTHTTWMYIFYPHKSHYLLNWRLAGRGCWLKIYKIVKWQVNDQTAQSCVPFLMWLFEPCCHYVVLSLWSGCLPFLVFCRSCLCSFLVPFLQAIHIALQ